MGEPRGRGRRQRGNKPVLGELPHPVAEIAGRKAARGDDEPGSLGRVEELTFDDAGEQEVAKRAVPLPALVAVLDDDALRRRARIEVGEFGEPVEARSPVPGAVAPVGLLEVIGERARVGP
jgi:hypothetical protein